MKARITNTTDRRLAFALRFAQMDTVPKRPAEWAKLKEDIATFIGLGPMPRIGLIQAGADVIQVREVDFTSPSQYPDKYVIDLQRSVRDLIAFPLDKRWNGLSGTKNLDDRVTIQFICDIGPLGIGQQFFFFSGTVRDLFLALLIGLLLQTPADRIRRCPECDKIFLRIRKQQYCSRLCTKRANMRDWRQTPEGQRYNRTQARKRYEQKVQKKTPGAQPQRYKKRIPTTPR